MPRSNRFGDTLRGRGRARESSGGRIQIDLALFYLLYLRQRVECLRTPSFSEPGSCRLDATGRYDHNGLRIYAPGTLAVDLRGLQRLLLRGGRLGLGATLALGEGFGCRGEESSVAGRLAFFLPNLLGR